MVAKHVERLGLLILVLQTGCTQPPSFPASTGTGSAAGAGFAVVCSDFATTAIAILAPDAVEVTAPVLVHSGSVAPGVQAALGGDVDLPTTSPPGGEVILVDRVPNSVLTVVDPVSGRVRQQIKVSEAFVGNPHDVYVDGSGRFVVTRYNANPDPGPEGDSNAGDDVILLAPDGVLLDFVSATDEDGFPGRPDRLVFHGGHLWVSLNRASGDFGTWREGALLELDLQPEGTLESLGRLLIPETRNCGGLAAHDGTLAVACTGAFEDGAPSADGAAVVLLDEAGQETARITGDHEDVQGAFGYGVELQGDGRVALVRLGSAGGQADAVLVWNPADGSVETVYEATGAFEVGTLGLTQDDDLVIPVGDAVDPKVCIVRPGQTLCHPACEGTGLPPRSVRRIAFPAAAMGRTGSETP